MTRQRARSGLAAGERRAAQQGEGVGVPAAGGGLDGRAAQALADPVAQGGRRQAAGREEQQGPRVGPVLLDAGGEEVLALWGQDRLWLFAREIQRLLGERRD